jgi:hypothetical protein
MCFSEFNKLVLIKFRQTGEKRAKRQNINKQGYFTFGNNKLNPTKKVSLELSSKLFIQPLHSVGFRFHQLPILKDGCLNLFQHLTTFVA